MLTSRISRKKYSFSADFFRPDGRVTFADYSAARAFAARLSKLRAEPVPASDIYAMYLLDEALHIILLQYHNQNPGVMARGLGLLQSNLGSRFEKTLTAFTEEFPPVSVYRGEMTAGAYLALTRPPLPVGDGRGVRGATVEEMLLLNISNQNPALQPYKELFDDSVLRTSAYGDLLVVLTDFLALQPGFGSGGLEAGETLYDILAAPSKASPYSLEGQLQFMIQKWGFLLGDAFIQRILRGIDFVREEVMRHQGPRRLNGEAQVPTFSGSEYAGYERYSPDKDWMPRLVLIAKNSYVWLDQLSKKYQRDISRLDQIPDEELDVLSQRGFTGLWLIGLWERSRASQRIKQRMGQGDAVASAYSLYSYDIASDLGGWDALSNLRERAWRRGIRLSADMVPNHMGIDSNWVIEHPDWFLSTSQPPYPAYTFNSESLSDDYRVQIVLEDHYYNHSDASVVFKRHDRPTGDTRYIYHGNDGTSFPWNDTAQLDYSQAQVREAVIQVILHVARNFPVIRFDAAMTLAKKHIQRLWFPEPGAGGAIPSRAERGMTRSEFDAAIPQEFWREVVDRVAAEVPDTLLLAEAFWLMEGYFVRTLGMHRVYNSAFMHMLRDEDNAKYRMAIKNTLEFDPQILKRYVNFMSNPDEKTAIEQFGNGDKYFGIATLLSTLPGLPMFGHGQVEGFREKYGMEFRRAKWDEQLDEGLVRGHEWKISPLLHRRYLFADVEQFLLYDFFTINGSVDENVFAYSNRFDPSTGSGQDQRGLMIYNNKFRDTRGWIKTSAAFLENGKLHRKSLAEGLGLSKSYAIFKDYVSQLEYIRPCRELTGNGLYVELGAYQCHVFMDWRFVSGEQWKAINDSLNGVGVESMQAKWDEMFGIKDEGSLRGMKDEVVNSKKLRSSRKVVKKKEVSKKKVVSRKPVVKKSAVKEAVVVKKIVTAKAKPVATSSAKGRKPAPKKTK
jgi:glycosidase